MKVQRPASPPVAVAQKSEQPEAPKSAGSTQASAWQGKPSEAPKKALVAAATHAVTTVLADPSAHPMLEKFGEHLGLGLGVIVTEALALSSKWNKPLVDEKGKPVQHIEGADRIGDHDLRTRHQEVVGPKILALVEKMSPGAVHDLLEGLGRGASAAPGTSYRLEAAAADLLNKR